MSNGKIIKGDCLDVMALMPSESIDLILTSPPYAQQRKATYGGTPPDKYVEWFLPISAEIKRVLKPTGSFILNIKEHVSDGERSTYVYELILALRQQGWRWVDDFAWHKKNGFPGRWPNRLRDAWEHCYHFTKQKDFSMYQDAVKQPAKPSTLLRAAHLSEQDRGRWKSQTLSGLDRDISSTLATSAEWARCSGVEDRSSLAWTSAPASSRSLATSADMTLCSGVEDRTRNSTPVRILVASPTSMALMTARYG